jgi:CRISPR-associated protein Cas2
MIKRTESRKQVKPETATGKSFVVVAYDISDDKRRTRLHKKLKKYGLGVQYSVFECVLSQNQIKEVQKMIRTIIKKKQGDRVRYYFLCESCRKRIEATDGLVVQDPPVVFI